MTTTNKTGAISFTLLLLLLGPASCGGGDDPGSSVGEPLDCRVCDVKALDCSISGASSLTATATIDRLTANGCRGTLTAGSGSDLETDPLWIHCDTGRICIEHEDECFKGASTARSFSYSFEKSSTTVRVACNGR
jgi:hypothetical protein